VFLLCLRQVNLFYISFVVQLSFFPPMILSRSIPIEQMDSGDKV
jgi:hypothetical protein